jgi:hypothetical protein
MYISIPLYIRIPLYFFIKTLLLKKNKEAQYIVFGYLYLLGKVMNRELENAQKRRYCKRYPEKIRAHRIVYKAIRQGELKKLPCIICGCLKVEAHHDDYDKPLDVIWVCKNHHYQLDINRPKK